MILLEKRTSLYLFTVFSLPLSSQQMPPKAIIADTVQVDLVFDNGNPKDHANSTGHILKKDRAQLGVINEEAGRDDSDRISFDDKSYMANKRISDPQVRKTNFLRELTTKIPKGAKAVNLNLRGHGILGTDGKWYFTLPNTNKGKIDGLYKTTGKKERFTRVNGKKSDGLVVDVNHPEFRGNYMSFSELSGALREAGVEQIYGTVGSCHSGGICKDMANLRGQGIEASLIAGSPRTEVMAGFKSTGTNMNDFLNQVRANPQKFDTDKNGQISFGELRAAAEALRTDDIRTRVTEKGNTVTQNHGFQPQLIDSKFWGSKTSLDDRVYLSYAHPNAKPQDVMSETHVTGDQVHGGLGTGASPKPRFSRASRRR